jgi:uncharacterized protein YjbJ (UPF0337 family)
MTHDGAQKFPLDRLIRRPSGLAQFDRDDARHSISEHKPNEPRSRRWGTVSHDGTLFGIPTHTREKETKMDKDRIKGSAEQAKGAVKEAVGKVTGDSKLEGEGKADKAAGKVQNAVGGLKDSLRGK